ncbi:hypothetical protein IPM62_06095 [Candidatus Woesebacteria bacterium]|nr:MAG: hypothetical protein IPM62_06095 [Candidatus Woesebacteria bacterium]
MSKKIKKILKQPKTGILISLGLFFVAVIIFVVMSLLGKEKDVIEKGQIQITRGDRVVTVNENGLIEYRSEEGVFYETWDPSRTNAFFASMEAAARQYLEKTPGKKFENGYEIKLWLDGEIVTIYVSEDDEVVGEIIEEIFQEYDDGDDDDGIGDYFDQDEDEDDEDDGDYTGNPTPTLPFGTTATPNPTITGTQGGSKTVQTPPDCDLYGTLVTGRTVISNTICNIE